jgi:outer membrane protein assembly factor BamB
MHEPEMSHLLTHKNLDRSGLRTVFAALICILASAACAFAAAERRPSDPSAFTKCWELPVNSNLGTSPASDDSAVYFLDDENKLHGLDLLTGRSAWSSEVGGAVVSNLAVLGDSIFLVTSPQFDVSNPSAKNVLRALSRQTGITVWQAEINSSPEVWLGVAMGNVIAAGVNGSISAFAREDGKLLWKADVASGVTSEPHFHEMGIELVTENREVIRVSPATGGSQVVWKSLYRPTAILSDQTGRLIVGDERGNLVLVAADGSRIWRFRNGAQISSALRYDSEYIATSHDNFVYKLTRGGNVEWKRRLSGRAADKPIILGNTAVVSVVGTGSVYALDLRNGKILNRIETADEVSLRLAGTEDGKGFIVAGPRSLLYFSSGCPSK